MWRRSVRKRSPDGRASTRAGSWRVTVTFSSRAATPRFRRSAAQRWSAQWRSSQSSSPAVATCERLPADEAREGGRSRPVAATSAVRARRAGAPTPVPGAVAKTLPAPPITAGTDASCKRVAHGPRVAVAPHEHGEMARAYRLTGALGAVRSPLDDLGTRGQAAATTSAARSWAITSRAAGRRGEARLGVRRTSPSSSVQDPHAQRARRSGRRSSREAAFAPAARTVR